MQSRRTLVYHSPGKRGAPTQSKNEQRRTPAESCHRFDHLRRPASTAVPSSRTPSCVVRARTATRHTTASLPHAASNTSRKPTSLSNPAKREHRAGRRLQLQVATAPPRVPILIPLPSPSSLPIRVHPTPFPSHREAISNPSTATYHLSHRVLRALNGDGGAGAIMDSAGSDGTPLTAHQNTRVRERQNARMQECDNTAYDNTAYDDTLQ